MNWRGSLSRHSSHLKRSKQCDRQVTALRQMQKEDLQEVNLLLSKAFTHARIQQGYREARVPLCRKEFLELYFAANSSGCFVIEKKLQSNFILFYPFVGNCELAWTFGRRSLRRRSRVWKRNCYGGSREFKNFRRKNDWTRIGRKFCQKF